MDSLTQIVLGAAVGELVLGRKVGSKAMMWGAVAGTIPDLDVLSSFFLDDLAKNEVHRGFTHSILFCALAAPIFAWLVKNYERYFLSFFIFLVLSVFLFSDQVSLSFKLVTAAVGIGAVTPILLKLKRPIEASKGEWSKMFWWCLFTHPILDCHTSWGTQLLWPLPYKFAWNNIFVADLCYTLPFLICLLIARFMSQGSSKRHAINRAGILISSAYMLLTLVFKYKAHTEISASLNRQNIPYTSLSTRPTPFNTIMWSANVSGEETYHLAYYSLLDTKPEVDFVRVAKDHHLLGDLASHEKVKRLVKLSQGEYVITKRQDTLIFNDLRFGQFGELAEQGKFVFAYKLIPDGADLIVKEIPPPRPEGEEFNEVFSVLINRIKGE